MWTHAAAHLASGVPDERCRDTSSVAKEEKTRIADRARNAEYNGPTFVDLFAGCGGLSLGLLQAGWTGLFAAEVSPHAFLTLRRNLVDGCEGTPPWARLRWPSWLPLAPYEIGRLLATHGQQLQALRGTLDLVVGGPPCQGFSTAGLRRPEDPRNQLFRHYVEFIALTQPALVLVENVVGMKLEFRANGSSTRCLPVREGTFADLLRAELQSQGYLVQQDVVRACDYGVPQLRPRFLSVGYRRSLLKGRPAPRFFEVLRGLRPRFLLDHSLPVDKLVTVKQALSDLRTEGKLLVACTDSESPPGFREVVYERPVTRYQQLMHSGMNGAPINSLRLPNHRAETVAKFQTIQASCRRGVQLSVRDRARLGINKHAICPLSPDQPSHTVTTLPDDLLHYSEPRVHSVREHARLQSFPDWFGFYGKYTTGGKKRVRECPRYTQVGNAVPPLLAEAAGWALAEVLEYLRQERKGE